MPYLLFVWWYDAVTVREHGDHDVGPEPHHLTSPDAAVQQVHFPREWPFPSAHRRRGSICPRCSGVRIAGGGAVRAVAGPVVGHPASSDCDADREQRACLGALNVYGHAM